MKQKHARYQAFPTPNKTPRILSSPPSDTDAPFKWRVNDRFIDYDYSKLGWCNCESRVLLKDVVQELQGYEGLTWQEVRQKSRHNHSWELHDIPKELRNRLKEIALDYLPELFQISLANKPRVWGFKDIGTYFLIWYDPEHLGYKTRTK